MRKRNVSINLYRRKRKCGSEDIESYENIEREWSKFKKYTND